MSPRTATDRPDAEVVDAPAPVTVRRDHRAAGRIPGAIAAALGLAWVVSLAVIFGLEPPPDPDASPSLLGFVVSMVLLYAIVGTAMGLAMRQRWGAMASMVGGMAVLGGATLCMLGGHSGLWLTAQFAGGAGLTAMSWGVVKAT